MSSINSSSAPICFFDCMYASKVSSSSSLILFGSPGAYASLALLTKASLTSFVEAVVLDERSSNKSSTEDLAPAPAIVISSAAALASILDNKSSKGLKAIFAFASLSPTCLSMSSKLSFIMAISVLAALLVPNSF